MQNYMSAGLRTHVTDYLCVKYMKQATPGIKSVIKVHSEADKSTDMCARTNTNSMGPG